MFRQDSGADKIDYLRQAIDRSRIGNPDVFEIVSLTVSGEYIATGTREYSPSVIGVLGIPKNRCHSWMLSFELAINGRQLGEIFRRRNVEKSFVINQSDRFHRDGISPIPVTMTDRLPRFAGEPSLEFLGNFNRAYQPSIRPFSDFVVGPDHDIRSLAHLRSNGKTMIAQRSAKDSPANET